MRYTASCDCCGYFSDTDYFDDLPAPAGSCQTCGIEMCEECPEYMTDDNLDVCEECYLDWQDSKLDEEPSGVDALQDTLPWGTEEPDPQK